MNADLDVVVRVHLGREATQMEDSLVSARVDPHRIELLQLVADADDHVRLVETKVDVVMAHEPHRAECVRVIVGEHALAVEGSGHRDAELLREALQGSRRAGPGRAVPGQHDRAGEPRRSTAAARSICEGEGSSGRGMLRSSGDEILWHAAMASMSSGTAR